MKKRFLIAVALCVPFSGCALIEDVGCNDYDEKCNGKSLMRCYDGIWDKVEECTNGCFDDDPKKVICYPKCEDDTFKCSDDETALMSCNSKGKWKKKEDCEGKCSKKDSLAGCFPEDDLCIDGQTICDDANPRIIKICNNNAWKQFQNCGCGCTEANGAAQCLNYASDGTCRLTCEDGELKCSEKKQNVLMSCLDGAWDVEDVCEGTCVVISGKAQCSLVDDIKGDDPEGGDLEGSDPEGGEPEGSDPEGGEPEGSDPEGGDPEEIICSDGALKCSDSKEHVLICSGNQWINKAECSHGCEVGDCLPPPEPVAVCENDVIDCNDSGQVIQCVSGQWQVTSSCDNGCENGQCVSKPEVVQVCSEGVIRCSSENSCIQRCVSGNWAFDTACEFGCLDESSCRKSAACTSGSVQCSSDSKSVEVCSNTVWTKKEVCEVTCQNGKCVDPHADDTISVSTDSLIVPKSDVVKITATYKKSGTAVSNAKLVVSKSSNDCYVLVNGQEYTTSDKGKITIKLNAAQTKTDCADTLVVSLKEDSRIKASTKIRTAVADTNGNHMFDAYETAPKLGASCHKYSDCKSGSDTGFCDSFLGYKCSTKCTDNSQCLDGFICRPDGRCAAEAFELIFNITEPEFALPTKTADNCDFYVYWGDGTSDHITNSTCKNSVESNRFAKHRYSSSGQYHIKIKGTYDGWRICNPGLVCSSMSAASDCTKFRENFIGVVSFGPVGLGDSAFTGASLNQFPTIDIPDATKLTNINNLVCRMQGFNFDMTKWDMSYVTSMRETFYKDSNFNQNISKWDLSRLKNVTNAFLSSGLSQTNYCNAVKSNSTLPASGSSAGLGYTCN